MSVTLCCQTRYFPLNERKPDTTMGRRRFSSSYYLFLTAETVKMTSCMEGRYVQRVYKKRVTYRSEITQMSFSLRRYLNLKIYSILFILQESYTNDPSLNTCMVFLHLDTKYWIMYSLVKMNTVIWSGWSS